jgi:hypothetical protein
VPPKTWTLPVVPLALLLGAAQVHAEPVTPSHPLDSIFFIARSENRNQVHYGIHVDENCRPMGSTPVYAYWRMFEKGPTATEQLLGLEEPVYGLAEEQPVSATTDGFRVRVQLRSTPERPIDVLVFRSENGRCATRALTRVGGADVQIDHIFVQNVWPFGIGEVSLHAVSAEGQAVRDVIRK